jgi:hypothetical protein
MTVGDNVYILDLESGCRYPKIINRKISNFLDASISSVPFYTEEALVISLKNYIYNDEHIKVHIIHRYYSAFKICPDEIYFYYLKGIIKGLDRTFINTEDKGSFPIDLVSYDKEPLEKLKRFSKKLCLEDFTIYKYIEKTLR